MAEQGKRRRCNAVLRGLRIPSTFAFGGTQRVLRDSTVAQRAMLRPGVHSPPWSGIPPSVSAASCSTLPGIGSKPTVVLYSTSSMEVRWSFIHKHWDMKYYGFLHNIGFDSPFTLPARWGVDSVGSKVSHRPLWSRVFLKVGSTPPDLCAKPLPANSTDFQTGLRSGAWAGGQLNQIQGFGCFFYSLLHNWVKHI